MDVTTKRRDSSSIQTSLRIYESGSQDLVFLSFYKIDHSNFAKLPRIGWIIISKKCL